MEIRTLTEDTIEEILSWSDSVEFLREEGELEVDNGYVKFGQQVALTSEGNVYKIEKDLAKDIEKLKIKRKYLNF